MINDILNPETRILHLDEIKGPGVKELCNLININKGTYSAYKNWYLFNGELYYFKNVSSHDAIINEFVGKKISEYFEIPNVDHEFAEFNSILGIASKNFRQHDLTYYNGEFACFDNRVCLNSLSNIESLKKLYAKRSKALPTIMETKRLVARDIYCGETDRHANNIFFSKGSNGVHVAPLFDNEFEFSGDFDCYETPFLKIKVKDASFKKLLDTDTYLCEQVKKIKYIDMDKIIADVINEKNIKMPTHSRDRLLKHDDKVKKLLNI